jgi:hypothetical protein
MDPDLASVYRYFGFDVPPAAPAAPSLAAAAAAPAEAAPDREALPGIADIDRARADLDRNPRAVLKEVREAWDSEITEWQLRAALQKARDALAAPRTFMMAAAADEVHAVASQSLPPGFSFPGMGPPPIGIVPGASKFEPHADAEGWALSWVASKLNLPPKPRFRQHTEAASRFEYPLEEPTAAAPVEVALFSDFGTGLYYSQYIARQIQRRTPDFAFHLGDVYYAGQRKEFEKNFTPFVEPLLARTPLFLLVANHEMMANGKPYLDYLDGKRARFPATQAQEGTYFRVVGAKFQVVGVDTDWFGKNRLPPEQAAWLDRVLRDGRARGLVNVLLTANPPYTYGSARLARLYTQSFQPLAAGGLIDLWFWGDTHYCALFDRSAATPFVGSCIGHAGHPFPKQVKGRPSPASVRFLETAARFPRATGLRQDVGDPGFCMMTLRHDGSVGLRYVDWMDNVRCVTELARPAAGAPLEIASCVVSPDP